MQITYIYGIRDLETDRFIYIGKSNDPQGRFRGHMCGTTNAGVQELVEEKGEDNFHSEILEVVEFEVPEDWIKREKFWIAKFRDKGSPLCNKNDGGGFTRHTEETKARMSRDRLGKNNSMYGRHHTEKTKIKMSMALSGDNSPRGMLGKHHAKETRVKQSAAKLGEKNPNYGKFGKDHPAYGRKDSEETRAKKRKAKSGKNNPMYKGG